MKQYSGLFNVILFQIGWWTCLWAATIKMPWIAAVVTCILLGLHLKFVSDQRMSEAKSILITSLLGIGIDFVLLKSGLFWIQLDQSVFSFPVWLAGMWFLFSSTLSHSMSSFQQRPLWAAVAGGVFGPLSYYVGESFGILNFNEPRYWTFSLFALLWSVLFPSVLWIHRPKIKTS